MRTATGVPALFLALLLGMYAYSRYTLGQELNSLSYTLAGIASAIVMLLYIFGGALSFKEPMRAGLMFVIALVISLLTGAFLSWIMLIFAVLSFVLFRMSGKAVSEVQDVTVTR
ncbi:hypothetical protein [Paenibacillus oryzisoli]|uniref:Uncharacterized protein n=1 Tax=Paenibacillus oryzisoli TaxID=1850517 RepID=A0A198A0I7_9BACL|nr:hypothetical protein [Paenibacillus oryzisoli]OAS14607.1 hypothetical protein A8708_34510 [Paenibacillus oryzisoli]